MTYNVFGEMLNLTQHQRHGGETITKSGGKVE